MSKKITLTIGIPAYNEEANIGFLLDRLLQQKQQGFILEKIIVSSDASSDKTDAIVRSYAHKGVELIKNKKREGQAVRQNQILRHTKNDILVLLNADTLPVDNLFLKDLIQPIIHNSADLTSSKYVSVEASNFFGKVLETSVRMKTFIYDHYKNGDNIYNCYGCARAFSHRLYSILQFENSIGEDAYSYLFCIQKGMRFQYVPNTKVLLKIPDNMVDHQKQSLRFIQSQKIMEKNFGAAFTKGEYHFPFFLPIQAVISEFFKNPTYALTFVILFCFISFKSLFATNIQNTWDISRSSKKLIT